jgi:KDO2-lipid IV(A) lauroyltransferase
MTRVLAALLWLLHGLPLAALAALGNALGVLAYWLIPERRRVTRINLRMCFPQLSEAERERIARAHFRAFCRGFLEYSILWWAPRSRIERLIRVEGLEHLRALQGAPVILFAPHFLLVDAGFARLACEFDMTGMYAQQKNRGYSRLLEQGRRRFGDQRIVSRQEGIRPLFKWMREGRPLYYLPDMDYGPRDAVFVPFFGVQAATVPGLSRIAKLTGAKVLPCVTRMLPGGQGYVVTIEPPWESFPSNDLVADTRRMNQYLEKKIPEMPEQYLWMHKRFKTRPPGEEGFY